MNHWLHRFAVFTACATFCLIMAGALVTSHDAGLSVPDWPLSYGSLTPPWVGNIRYEHGHRMVAASVGLLTVCLAMWLWRREPRRWVRRLGLAALGAVVAQGVLGGMTVLFFLPPPVSIAHACLAQTFFCVAVTLAVVTGARWIDGPPEMSASELPPIARLCSFTTAAVFLQLLLGAALRHKVLGVAPHLAGAALATSLVILVVHRVGSRHAHQPGLLWGSRVLAAVLMLQLLLGVSAYAARVLTQDAPQPLPLMVWTTVAHVATGALTLASALWLTLEAWRGARHAVPLHRGVRRATTVHGEPVISQ